MKHLCTILLLPSLVLLSLVLPAAVFGQETPGPHLTTLRKLDERIPIKTTGGILFWGDVFFDNGWHIQHNVVTDSYRLLDDNAVQRAYGTFDECKDRLASIQADEGTPPMSGTIAVILHGFGSNSLMTRNLADWLRERETHDYVFCMSYPSTMQSILNHARMLDRLVQNLPPAVTRIDFIGHSLGSLVIRRYLSGPLEDDWQVPDDRMAFRRTFSPDPRVGRFVMLGPPNHGAVIATRLIGNDPIRRFLTGKSGDELGMNWQEVEKTLGIPCCPFMIVAGGRGNNMGFSLLIPGDNDGMVSTEGTQLEGAEKWMLFNVGHNEMLLSQPVFNAIERFLLRGE
ncbi:MAG: alpha/beta hydrolase [Planctomycetaceae bacterium]|nr:alpha/beta hydrolase [Planctomycetaceae bacterium]